MSRRCLSFAAGLILFSRLAFAQPGGSLPRVGSQLPDVRAFDDTGREFSLSELRGEYSVLVFGCLT